MINQLVGKVISRLINGEINHQLQPWYTATNIQCYLLSLQAPDITDTPKLPFDDNKSNTEQMKWWIVQGGVELLCYSGELILNEEM